MAAGWGAGGLAPAAAAEGFALVADRSEPAGPLPRHFDLAANRTVPEGPTPPQYVLTAAREPGCAQFAQIRRRRLRWPYLALLAALLIHLAAVGTFVRWPSQQERFGMEDGVPDNLPVSVISAAELDRLSSDPFRREAAPIPTPTPDVAALPSPPPEPPPAPPPKPEQKPVQEADAWFTPEPSKARKTQKFDAAGFIQAASAQFSAELDHAFKAAKTRGERPSQSRRRSAKAEARAGGVSVMRPGATHKGKSDPFAREVVWALAATKPMGNGKYGTVIVTFRVSNGGRLQGLRMIKSAGDKWLDTAVMMSVNQARMPKPPEPLPVGDRTFVVEYISMEDGRGR
jgi:protein TonB